jgi:hypothetical protein
VTVTVTAAAFATEEDMLIDELDIFDENMAGYDPEELGASTLPSKSTIAASRASLPLMLVLGRLKVPSATVMTVSAAISTANVI